MAPPRGFAVRFPEGVRRVALFPVPRGHVCLLSGELSLWACARVLWGHSSVVVSCGGFLLCTLGLVST